MKKLLGFLLAATFLGFNSLSYAESPPKKLTPDQIASLAKTMKPDEFKKLMEALNTAGGLPSGVTVKPDPKPEPKPESGRKSFPAHWGKPPLGQTRDSVEWPGGYGKGSGTVAKWIEKNMQADLEREKLAEKPDTNPRPEKGRFGLWLGEDGFIIPGPKTTDFVDSDQDGIDDRIQPKPGAPAAKRRPEKPDGGDKPGTGGPDPKPEKPGGKPDGQLGGGERPKPPAPIRPQLPPKKPLPKELTKKMNAYKETQDVLRDELKAKIDALGDDATREDIKNAAEAFKADNQDRIDAQIAAAKEIHEGLKANRPKHDKGDRPEPPAAVKEKADAMKDLHQLLGKARHDLHESLKNASKEEREAMIAAFREAQKDHHQQLKQAKKALREAIRDNAQTGDRRSED